MKRAEMLGPFNINILSKLFRKYKIFLTFDPIYIYGLYFEMLLFIVN